MRHAVTRINVTPSWAVCTRTQAPLPVDRGLTVGNAWIAKVNYEIAVRSGDRGKFLLIIDDVLGRRMQQPFLDEVNDGTAELRYEAALEQLRYFGILPAAPWPIKTSNYLQDYTKLFRSLPLPTEPIEPYYGAIAPSIRLNTLSYGTPFTNPFWYGFSAYVDMSLGVNAFVNGEDCHGGHSLYALMAFYLQAHLVDAAAPAQFVAPLIYSPEPCPPRPAPKIAGSWERPDSPYFLGTLMDLGVDPETLWSFLEDRLTEPGASYSALNGRGKVSIWLQNGFFRRDPVLSEDDLLGLV